MTDVPPLFLIAVIFLVSLDCNIFAKMKSHLLLPDSYSDSTTVTLSSQIDRLEQRWQNQGPGATFGLVNYSIQPPKMVVS